MGRGVSIHIGVNRAASMAGSPLLECEAAAWRMSGIAFQAGYQDIHLLQGPAATRDAVRALLDSATRALQPDQTLFVSFAGHGSHAEGRVKERQGSDETWCLSDGDLVDNDLAEYWKQLPEGARALVVDESCYSGGMGRPGDSLADYVPQKDPVIYRSGGPMVSRSAEPVYRGVKQTVHPDESCIASSPGDDDGIRASVLMLTAASESQVAEEGLYTRRLLDVWNGGKFTGTFCELHRLVCEKVKRDKPAQDPQIFMLGKADLSFPEKKAFHLAEPVTRGGDVLR
jgi:hypothetical protein